MGMGNLPLWPGTVKGKYHKPDLSLLCTQS